MPSAMPVGQFGATGPSLMDKMVKVITPAREVTKVEARAAGATSEAGRADGSAVGGAGSEFGPAEQAGGFRAGGGGGDLAGRAGLAELAAGDDGQVVADAQCFVAVVGHVHGGDVQGSQEF